MEVELTTEKRNNMNLKEFQVHLKRMKEDPEYKREWMQKARQEAKDNFKNIKPMVLAKDVPDLPHGYDKEEWERYFVPILIERGAIPKKDLVDGEWYYGEHRNCNFAKWNKNNNRFDYIRYKFGYFWDCCNHFEDDDGFALFVPLRKATNQEIKKEEEHLNK
jgi:hypothetical protein